MIQMIKLILLCFAFDLIIQTNSLKDKVFLLVFDGFVHDFEKLSSKMPNFAKLAKQGVKGKGLIPPFPSSTWPCMVTLTTGLYPESHGIINNNFFDKEGTYFSWTGDPSNANNTKFFSQEPVWLSNQKQKGVSSVYYWPGYYAFKEKPNYHNKRITPFGANITTGREAIDETFEYYDNNPSLNFMVVYVDAPDETGHEHGVKSKEYKDRIEALDKDVLGYLIEKLSKYPEINLVVVADHGQINVDQKRIYYISDYVDKDMLAVKPYCGSMCTLQPASGYASQQILEKLSPLKKTGGFRFFNKDNLTMQPPTYLHYTNNKLIPPILILPSSGWILYDERRNTTSNKTLQATHGYDPFASKEMHTIFFARGPAFKKNVTMDPFESVNVYPLLAHLLGIKPRPNNGSLSVFKYVLKEWSPKEEIKLPGKYTKFVYAMIFVGGVILAIVLMSLAYYLLVHGYRRCCNSGQSNYSRVSKMHFEDLEDEDQF